MEQQQPSDISEDVSSDEENPPPIGHILTVIEMQEFGVKLTYNEKRTKRAKTETNEGRFLKSFGVTPKTACVIYENLQQTTNQTARIEKPDATALRYFLISLYFLRNYPTREDLERQFDYSRGWIAAKCWEWAKRIDALREEKIVLSFEDDTIWVMTVDGTHVWIQNPEDPSFTQNPKYYSHKYNKAGMTAELGISLNGGLIWLNGPFPAATSDIQMFRKPGGLGETLRQWGRRCIADRGYRGQEDVDVVSTPNPLDSKPVSLFKRRALNRHENFNCMTKVFKILQGPFRHDEVKFGVAFRAVCVLCQYKLENEVPLYDVLIPAVIDGFGAPESEDEDSDSDQDADSGWESESEGSYTSEMD